MDFSEKLKNMYGENPRKTGQPHYFLFLLSFFGIAFCMTCLYLGMRGVMRLGGFVASGGPYVIAHQAPGWIWIFPASILVGVVCVLIQFTTSSRIEGVKLAALAWPALFVSLGWNFLEFGIHPPGGRGLAWGWLICALFFFFMGLFPLVWVVKGVRQGIKSGKVGDSMPDASPSRKKLPGALIFLLQIILVIVGILLGRAFFNSLAHAQEKKAVEIRQEEVQPGPAQSAVLGSAIELKSGGKTLMLSVNPLGRWHLSYGGQVYDRISDLPDDARREFGEQLENLKKLLK